jgi:hypothetical protein
MEGAAQTRFQIAQQRVDSTECGQILWMHAAHKGHWRVAFDRLGKA